MNTRKLVCALLLCLASSAIGTAQGTRLLRHPTVSRDSVAFEYAGDLWIVSRSGGQARRLTSTSGAEIDPYFSPDGSQIAFTATVAGNTDVYVVPSAGGDPKRLTYHPGIDRARGWTPDGKRVIFASVRDSSPQQAYFQLWSVSVDGGFPERLPMPRAFSASYSSDARRIAYDEITLAFTPDWYETSMWRHYRGGRTHPIQVMNLADYSVDRLPWANSNDSLPMWIGNTIYFLSDRNFTTNLFAYNESTKQITQLTRHDDFDIMTASAGPYATGSAHSGDSYLVAANASQAPRRGSDDTVDLAWGSAQCQNMIN